MTKPNIRFMTQADIPRVAEIHVAGWRNTYRGIVADEVLFGRMSVSRSTERFTQLLRTGNDDSYVYDDGITKGFMTIMPCRNDDTPDAFELGGIYIDPAFQHTGIGTIMIAAFEKIASQKGYSCLCLWVLTENNQARRFYEKMGYAPDGTSQFLDRLNAWEVRYTKNIIEDVI